MSKPLPACLIGAGSLGHPWVVTCLLTPYDAQHVRALCNEAADAVRNFDEVDEQPQGWNQQPRIFTRVRERLDNRGSWRWKEVTRAAAVIA